LVRVYTKQILEGLEYLHSHGVIHRDIKGANVLVDANGICKLADFGGAKVICSAQSNDGQDTNSLKGSPYWMAPEVIKQTGYGRYIFPRLST
jgi:serine/threonine protein kinase